MNLNGLIVSYRCPSVHDSVHVYFQLEREDDQQSARRNTIRRCLQIGICLACLLTVFVILVFVWLAVT